jgi:hypothetical protein
MKSTLTILALYLSATTLLSSCSKENAYQDDANQQNSLASQQKMQSLDTVKGTYTGTMHFTQGGPDLAVTIYLNDPQTNAPDPDQIDKVQVPTLVGNMSFPKIQTFQDMRSFPDMVQAMGIALTVNFLNGDFNTNTSMITLPYGSNGSTFGGDQVIGTFNNGTFSGEWDSHSCGQMGTFTVVRGEGSSS